MMMYYVVYQNSVQGLAMVKKVFYHFIILFTLFYSCNNKNNKVDDTNIVAIIDDEYLFKKDIVKLLPKNVSSRDSAIIVSNFVDSWLAERLFYEEATKKLKDSSDIVEKVNNYRRELYIHYFVENNVISDIDYNISEEEIKDYYTSHLEDYVLSTNYVKLHYLTMDSKINSYFEVLDKVKNSGLEDELMLKDYCIGTTRKVYFINKWIELEQFLNSVNYSGNISEYDLPQISMLDFVNKELRYIVKIDEYIVKGTNSPLDFVKDDIIQIIINNRKRDKYIRVKNNLIENAVNSGKVILK